MPKHASHALSVGKGRAPPTVSRFNPTNCGGQRSRWGPMHSTANEMPSTLVCKNNSHGKPLSKMCHGTQLSLHVAPPPLKFGAPSTAQLVGDPLFLWAPHRRCWPVHSQLCFGVEWVTRLAPRRAGCHPPRLGRVAGEYISWGGQPCPAARRGCAPPARGEGCPQAPPTLSALLATAGAPGEHRQAPCTPAPSPPPRACASGASADQPGHGAWRAARANCAKGCGGGRGREGPLLSLCVHGY